MLNHRVNIVLKYIMCKYFDIKNQIIYILQIQLFSLYFNKIKNKLNHFLIYILYKFIHLYNIFLNSNNILEILNKNMFSSRSVTHFDYLNA